MEEEFAYLSGVGADKGNLIKALQLIQEREGYVSDAAVQAAAKYFSLADAEVEGVLTFYAQFKRTKPGKYRISACDGTACHIKGAALILQWLGDALHIQDGETTADGMFSLTTVACLGCCSLAPVMAVNGRVYGRLDRKKLLRILNDCRKQG